jgi:predicted GNAT family acetyltransferase
MSIEVHDKSDESRYEALLDGQPVGFAYYRAEPGRVVFTHTEVRAEAEGKGVGSALVRSALDDVRRRGLSVIPLCPFVRSYIARHPEYDDLVP